MTLACTPWSLSVSASSPHRRRRPASQRLSPGPAGWDGSLRNQLGRHPPARPTAAGPFAAGWGCPWARCTCRSHRLSAGVACSRPQRLRPAPRLRPRPPAALLAEQEQTPLPRERLRSRQRTKRSFLLPCRAKPSTRGGAGGGKDSSGHSSQHLRRAIRGNPRACALPLMPGQRVLGTCWSTLWMMPVSSILLFRPRLSRGAFAFKQIPFLTPFLTRRGGIAPLFLHRQQYKSKEQCEAKVSASTAHLPPGPTMMFSPSSAPSPIMPHHPNCRLCCRTHRRTEKQHQHQASCSPSAKHPAKMSAMWAMASSAAILLPTQQSCKITGAR